MPDRTRTDGQVSHRLTALAEFAGEAVTPPSAEAIRLRAHRQAVRTRIAGGTLVVVLLVTGTVELVGLRPGASGLFAPAGIATTTVMAPSSTPSVLPSSTPTPVRRPSDAKPANSTPKQPEFPLCEESYLSMAIREPGNAQGGHRGIVLLFINAGARPCRIVGYPTVVGLDALGGTQVAQARHTLSGPLGGVRTGKPPMVTLAAEGTASAFVESLTFDEKTGDPCTAFRALSVTAPDGTDPMMFPWDSGGCSGLEVHPVVPGETGRLG